MSIRAQRLHGLPKTLNTPLLAPVLSALFAFIGWQVAASLGVHMLLVAERPIPAGTRIQAGNVRAVAWHGPLPAGALSAPAGYARLRIAPGVPILSDELSGTAPQQSRSVTVGLPGTALFSSPGVSVGEAVRIYYLSPAGLPEVVIPYATVAQAGQQGLSLSISADLVHALLTAEASGRLVVVLIGS